MKTIEEQARSFACITANEYACVDEDVRIDIKDDLQYAFVSGAEAATRWIPVEEEPIDKGNILIALDYRGGVHTMFWGAIAGHNRIIQNDRHDHTFKYYTHWLPIPPMPEK